MSKNSRNAKRPRLQTTRASDITHTHQFTHSSNTSTRTRQIVTSTEILPSESTESSLPSMEIQSDFPVLEEGDHPAGLEVLTKARRYVNSVGTIIFLLVKILK